MLDVLRDLAVNYVVSATPFFVTHLLLLIYFLHKWNRSRKLINRDLSELVGPAENSELLSAACRQILVYADQGREPDLSRLEKAVTDKVYRNLELGRLLINSFVVVGLMGTLFALFHVGHDAQILQGPQDVLKRMSVAFSASFFGLLCALTCNLFFTRALRRRATRTAQEVGRCLAEFSGSHPPKSSTSAIEQTVQNLDRQIKRFVGMIRRLELREETSLKTSEQILTEFRDTTNTVIANLASEVKMAQTQSAETLVELKTGISSSLEDLKKRFAEILNSWRTDLERIIKSSENAAERLANSSENLADATADVAISLQAVQQSLQRTEALAEIVNNVEALTSTYLARTGEQIDHFVKGLDVTLEASRTIPDEWFTMLAKRNSELSESLLKITSIWREHVTNTGEEITTRFDKVGQGVQTLLAPLAPEGMLTQTLGQIQDSVCRTQDWVDYKSRADLNVQLDTLVAVVQKLDATAEKFGPIISTNRDDETVPSRNGSEPLLTSVTDIHDLLRDLVNNIGFSPAVGAPGSLEFDVALPSPKQIEESAVREHQMTNNVDGWAGLTEKLDEIIVILKSNRRKTADEPVPVHDEQPSKPMLTEKGLGAWIRRRMGRNKFKQG